MVSLTGGDGVTNKGSVVIGGGEVTCVLLLLFKTLILCFIFKFIFSICD